MNLTLIFDSVEFPIHKMFQVVSAFKESPESDPGVARTKADADGSNLENPA